MSLDHTADGNMVDDIARFDLEQLMAESEKKKPWQSGLFTRTLFKKDDFRVVLISLENGAKLKEHHADGTISVQVVKGNIRFTVRGETYELAAGNLLTLGASIKHEVESVGESAFLLTISWPSSAELAAMKHRGYGS